VTVGFTARTKLVHPTLQTHMSQQSAYGPVHIETFVRTRLSCLNLGVSTFHIV